MSDFAISLVIGTGIYFFGSSVGFSLIEMAVLCVVGGIVQAIITTEVRGVKKK